ncbi:MAG: XRE family transcriptional regulator [Candidatus Cloacimonas sp.]|jgi:SOS-response transcriptional repressor LexA|nr:XRE family transcriptional regulator [Candidatus Cloacimonas sp.]
MDPNDIGSRLGMLIKSMNLKQYQFNEKFGISPNSLDRYKNNERFPEPQFLARLIDAGVNVNWLLRGEGSMFILAPWEIGPDVKTTKKMQIVNGKPTLVNDFDTTYVRTSIFPIVAEIAAGSPMEVPEGIEPTDSVEVPIRYIPFGTDNYVAFKINGLSMEPQILHGDIVLIKKQISWDGLDGKICAVRYETGITLKRIQYDEARKGVALQPLNKDYRIEFIDADQSQWLTMIGPVALQLRLY